MGAARPESEAGLLQFLAYESTGAQPANPDPYFDALLHGKRWFEWTINEYAALYFECWPGWIQLEEDFSADPAMLTMIRQRLGLTTKGTQDARD